MLLVASLASRVFLESSLTFSLISFRSVGFPDHRLIADITVEPAGKVSVVYTCILRRAIASTMENDLFASLTPWCKVIVILQLRSHVK